MTFKLRIKEEIKKRLGPRRTLLRKNRRIISKTRKLVSKSRKLEKLCENNSRKCIKPKESNKYPKREKNSSIPSSK